MAYDAAIIGAGANGLTAAAILSRAGLKVLVLERLGRTGGRLVTDNFHPGFSASAYCDRIPAIPAEVAALVGLWMPLAVKHLPEEIRARRDAALALIFAQARERRARGPLPILRQMMAPASPMVAWPGHDLASRALSDWPYLAFRALQGRATDPELAGSATTLLALADAEPSRGGLSVLGEAFTAAAQEVELRLDSEVSEVGVKRGPFGSRVTGLILADGSRVEAEAVISTLDFKRSILSLFPWQALPPAMPEAAARFRMGGGAARLLLAFKWRLAAPLPLPLLIPGDDAARAAFRRGALPEKPALLIDAVSARDPSLAPEGAATWTVTLAGIPARLFDGAWTHEKRSQLAAGALRRIEAALPGTLAALGGIRIVTPSDIEAQLGASEGDLDGGQLAPDQMLAFRPGARTQLSGFYLGGASCAAAPLGTGAAGFVAATSLLADRA